MVNAVTIRTAAIKKIPSFIFPSIAFNLRMVAIGLAIVITLP